MLIAVLFYIPLDVNKITTPTIKDGSGTPMHRQPIIKHVREARICPVERSDVKHIKVKELLDGGDNRSQSQLHCPIFLSRSCPLKSREDLSPLNL